MNAECRSEMWRFSLSFPRSPERSILKLKTVGVEKWKELEVEHNLEKCYQFLKYLTTPNCLSSVSKPSSISAFFNWRRTFSRCFWCWRFPRRCGTTLSAKRKMLESAENKCNCFFKWKCIWTLLWLWWKSRQTRVHLLQPESYQRLQYYYRAVNTELARSP